MTAVSPNSNSTRPRPTQAPFDSSSTSNRLVYALFLAAVAARCTALFLGERSAALFRFRADFDALLHQRSVHSMESPHQAVVVIAAIVACGSLLLVVAGVSVLRRRRPAGQHSDIEQGGSRKAVHDVRISKISLPGGSAGPV
jgi:hypothetical protein